MNRMVLSLLSLILVGLLAQSTWAAQFGVPQGKNEFGPPILLVDHRHPGSDRDRGRDDDRRDAPWYRRPYWREPSYRPPYRPHPHPGTGIGHPPVVIVPYPGHPPVLISPIPGCRPVYPYGGTHFYYRGKNFGLWIEF